MSETRKFSPMFILTQQAFVNRIFKFPFWLPTEYLVDKWHNQYMDIWWL